MTYDMTEQVPEMPTPKVDPNSAHHIVILIHGTWGRGLIFRKEVAEWCTSGSPCRAAVERGLRGTVCFDVFSWTGANSVGARLKAAERLAERVATLRQANPNAGIHMIAHSHGGNVAFYALRDAKVSAEIASVVCLSTPFILVKARKLGPQISETLMYAGAALLSFPAIILGVGVSDLLAETRLWGVAY